MRSNAALLISLLFAFAFSASAFSENKPPAVKYMLDVLMIEKCGLTVKPSVRTSVKASFDEFFKKHGHDPIRGYSDLVAYLDGLVVKNPVRTKTACNLYKLIQKNSDTACIKKNASEIICRK